HDENPAAEELWVKYVGHRLGNVLLPYYNHGGGRGGTPAEGGQYGVYMIDYSLIPYATLRDYLPGKADVFERTNFFAENFYYVLHSMLPGLTHDNGEMESHHQLFPFGDDEKFRSESLASFYIDAFSVYAQLWPDSALGRYARQAMDFLGVRPKRYFEGAGRGQRCAVLAFPAAGLLRRGQRSFLRAQRLAAVGRSQCDGDALPGRPGGEHR